METRDSAGNNLNVALLGFPKENDWILLSQYNDRSLVRNILSFYLFRQMGHYAPRAQLCEVVLNNTYQGIYVFTEKIKRDDNRAAIASMDSTDTLSDNISGGYIFKVDRPWTNSSWISKYSPMGHPGRDISFIHVYTKPDKILPIQKTYIQTFVNQFETALYSDHFRDPQSGYRKYIDVPSLSIILSSMNFPAMWTGIRKVVSFIKKKTAKTD